MTSYHWWRANHGSHGRWASIWSVKDFRRQRKVHKKVWRGSSERFRAESLPHRNSVTGFVEKLETTGNVLDQLRAGRPKVASDPSINLRNRDNFPCDKCPNDFRGLLVIMFRWFLRKSSLATFGRAALDWSKRFAVFSNFSTNLATVRLWANSAPNRSKMPSQQSLGVLLNFLNLYHLNYWLTDRENHD